MVDRFERYSRQMILPGWGREGQARLARQTAVVVGCGALGSHIRPSATAQIFAELPRFTISRTPNRPRNCSVSADRCDLLTTAVSGFSHCRAEMACSVPPEGTLKAPAPRMA